MQTAATKWPPQQLVEQRLVRCRIVDAVSAFLTPSSQQWANSIGKLEGGFGSCCSTANIIMIKRHGTKLRLSEWLFIVSLFLSGTPAGGWLGGGSQSRSVCLLVGECALKCVHSVVYAGPCFWQASRPHCQPHLVGPTAAFPPICIVNDVAFCLCSVMAKPSLTDVVGFCRCRVARLPPTG
jgi:hypothetical protein